MLKLWDMQITLLLLSLPGPLWTIEVSLDRFLCMDQIELLDV